MKNVEMTSVEMTMEDLQAVDGGWIGRIFAVAVAAVASAGHEFGEAAGEFAYNLGIEV